MLATRHFKITRSSADDWFDPILNADTKLFIDPFLIFKDKAPLWKKVHDKLIAHFDRAFILIAESNFNQQSLPYRKAISLLTFREPKELCLGYTAKGTGGAGGGIGYAETIADAIGEAIKRGLSHPKHFEELGILNQGIGSDRISDITATILKSDLISYTRTVADRHKIPLTKHEVYAGGFDEQRQRWDTALVDLPTNPFTGGALLLVPQRFIRELPTLNADDWWDSYEENQSLRTDLNYEIMGRVSKATIVAAAREHPDMVRKWTEEQEDKPQEPYDLKKDPKGRYQWDAQTHAFASQHPLALVHANSSSDFLSVLEKVIHQFKLFIEEQGGWALLWNDDGREKPEEAVQLLFRGIVQHYCHANNITVDREVELGRGPVDFKFSNGYSNRAHLEVKKISNSSFWDGLEHQLPSYMKSDEVSNGWLLAVRYRQNKQTEQRAKDLPGRVKKTAETTGLNIRYSLVDAAKPLSASKIKS